MQRPTVIGWLLAGLVGGCATGDSLGDPEFGPEIGASTDTDASTGPSTTASTSTGNDSAPIPPTTTTATTETTGGCDVQTWAADADQDGFGDPEQTVEACVAPDGYIEDATDCDDSDDQTYPGAQEICGGPDRDCDEMDPAPCTSCAELLEVGTGTESGVYTIDVDGPEQPLPSTDVWCDQETEGGGWTLVQRTVWDPTETIALRTDFATWYGQTLGDPAEGRGFRLQGEAWPYLDATQEHMLRHDIRQTSGESCDPLYYLGSEGELTVDEQTATLTGLVSDASMISGTELSTTDAGPSTNCINNNLGVPWFFGSCCATCPTYQGGYWNEPHPMANYVHTVPDAQGNTEADVCSTTVEMALDGSAFRGIASMAYYLR